MSKFKLNTTPHGNTSKTTALWELNRDETATIWYALREYYDKVVGRQNINTNTKTVYRYEDRADEHDLAQKISRLLSEVFEVQTEDVEREIRQWLDVE
jgi:hypothetical protein